MIEPGLVRLAREGLTQSTRWVFRKYKSTAHIEVITSLVKLYGLDWGHYPSLVPKYCGWLNASGHIQTCSGRCFFDVFSMTHSDALNIIIQTSHFEYSSLTPGINQGYHSSPVKSSPHRDHFPTQTTSPQRPPHHRDHLITQSTSPERAPPHRDHLTT